MLGGTAGDCSVRPVVHQLSVVVAVVTKREGTTRALVCVVCDGCVHVEVTI